MRLRSLSLAGFKSFADRTQFKLDGQIVAVVGPNGCGKSNIVDALRWVMGESRASQMRQDIGSNMIFNGAAGRPAMDLCTVTLQLVNDGSRDLGIWNEYAELSVRRSIERDSESSYFINGSRVRRRDIFDLFAGSGIGAQSYGIVAQEQITGIITADPKRIRSHLEEVAGVLSYKERRKESERKMVSTKANLERLEEIAKEKERQMASLALQAKQTVRVRKYKQEADLLYRYSLLLTVDELASAEQESKIAQQKLAGDVVEARKHVQAAQKQCSNARAAVGKLGKLINELQSKHFSSQAEVEQLRSKEREQNMRFEQEQAKLEEAKSRAAEISDSYAKLEEEEKKLVLETKKLVEELEKKEKKESHLRDALGKEKADLEQLALVAKKANDALSTAAGDLLKIKAERELMLHRLSDLRTSLDAARKELEDLGPPIDSDDTELESAREKLAVATKRAIDNERISQMLSQELNEANSELMRLQGLQGAYLAEQKLLDDLASESEQKQKRLASWLNDHGKPDVKRFSEVAGIEAQGLEAAVDSVLGLCLEGYLSEDCRELFAKDDLPAGMALLDKQSIKGPVFRKEIGLPLLSERIKTKQKWQQLVDKFLAGVYFAPDVDSAVASIDKLQPGEVVVCEKGQLLRPGVLFSAPLQGGGVASMARRAELAKLNEECAKKIESVRGEISQFSDAQDKCSKEGVSLAQARRDADASFEELQAEHIRLQHAREFRIDREKQLGSLIAVLNKDQQEKYTDLSCLEERLVEAKTMHTDCEKKCAAAIKDQDKQSSRVANEQSNYTSHENELREMRISIIHEQKREQELHERLASQQHSLHAAHEAVALSESRLASMSWVDFEEKISAADQLEKKARAKLEEAQRRVSEQASEEVSAESKLSAATAALSELDGKHRQFELDFAGKAAESKAAQAQLDEHGGAPEEEMLNDLRKKYPTSSAATEWMLRLRKRIEDSGPINYAADAEHAECERLLGETRAQTSDLETALASLRSAIDRIDREMLDRLRKVFAEVNSQFDLLFRRFFDGGSASLELAGDDMLSDGIVLKANPPGKRVSAISSLSGGEKTLTALSFLFALNSLNPPPFCVLDEVDAALDEANTVRFMRLVEAMRKEVQFLLITHNKVVIEGADVLVGVTQEEKGVSKLVTVKLDEVVANAKAAGG